MANKVFGADYTDTTSPQGGWTISVNNGTTFNDVALSDLHKALTKVPAEGQMENGRINVTVVANDLVVSLKTLAGNDPSSTDPISITINGTVRTIIAAISCTLADGTNWFNAGSAELATKEIDYFLYAIWDSVGGAVAISPARIPWGKVVSDFNVTSTNENHLANHATFAAGDDVVVIGRFAATLGVSATYLWTVPTFTGANLVQYPVFNTRILTWIPQWTGFTPGSATITAKYQIRETKHVRYELAVVLNSSTAGVFQFSLPFTCALAGTTPAVGVSELLDSGTASYPSQFIIISTTTARPIAFSYDPTLGAVSYAKQAFLSTTVPFTWANNDEVAGWGEYPV